jgi:hypothetical protein
MQTTREWRNAQEEDWEIRTAQSVCRLAMGLDGLATIPCRGKKFFSSPQRPDRLWGSHSLLYNGYRGALSPWVKRSGREADQSPPSSAEVENVGSIPPFHRIILHGVVLNWLSRRKTLLFTSQDENWIGTRNDVMYTKQDKPINIYE